MNAEVVAAAPVLRRRLAVDRKPDAAGNGWHSVLALPSLLISLSLVQILDQVVSHLQSSLQSRMVDHRGQQARC